MWCVFTKCCCCVPLRRGLLFWAYFRAILLVVLMGLQVYWTAWAFTIDKFEPWLQIRFILNAVDKLMAFAFSILLIVAAHKKCSKLLRISYKCEIGSLTFTTLLSIVGTIADSLMYPWIMLIVLRLVILLAFLKLLYIGIEVYAIALIRSELLKLEGSYAFLFLNNADEAEGQQFENYKASLIPNIVAKDLDDVEIV